MSVTWSVLLVGWLVGAFCFVFVLNWKGWWRKGNSDPWGCNNLQLFFPYPGSHLMPPCCCLLHSNEVETSECIHHSAPAPLYIHMHVHAYACQHMGVHMCARTHTHTALTLCLVPRQNWWWWAKETGKNSSGQLAGWGLRQQATNSVISCFAEYKSAETF